MKSLRLYPLGLGTMGTGINPRHSFHKMETGSQGSQRKNVCPLSVADAQRLGYRDGVREEQGHTRMTKTR